MEVKKFPLGSKVKLKTGSPVMTVTGYETEFGDNLENKFNRLVRKFNHVICAWNEGDEKHQDSFHIDDLEAVKS